MLGTMQLGMTCPKQTLSQARGLAIFASNTLEAKAGPLLAGSKIRLGNATTPSVTQQGCLATRQAPLFPPMHRRTVTVPHLAWSHCQGHHQRLLSGLPHSLQGVAAGGEGLLWSFLLSFTPAFSLDMSACSLDQSFQPDRQLLFSGAFGGQMVLESSLPYTAS